MSFWANMMLLKSNLESRLFLKNLNQKQGFFWGLRKSLRPQYIETQMWLYGRFKIPTGKGQVRVGPQI